MYLLNLKKGSLYLIILLCLGSLLMHLFIELDVGFGESQTKARLSNAKLDKMPQGLVMLSSQNWTNYSFNEYEIDMINSWLGKTINATFEFNKNSFLYKRSVNDFYDKKDSFSQLIGKLTLIANSRIKIIHLNKKSNLIKLTVEQYK